MRDLKTKSKFLALVLRHQPEKAGLRLDRNGWASIDELLNNTDFTPEELDALVYVKEGEKKRYEYSQDGNSIRAVQGHSIQEIDTQLPVKVPPVTLYHGTSLDAYNNFIRKEGLKPMSRKHVHLSPEVTTAMSVGNRKKGKTVILKIDTSDMVKNGQKFYHAESVNTWLTDFVDPKHIKPIP